MTAAQPNPAPTPRSSSGLFSLKRLPLILGIVVVVIIVAVVGSMYLPKSGSKGSKSTSLPLNPNTPGVSNAVVVYSFSDSIKNVTADTLELNSSQLPSFKLSDKTPVFKASTDKKSQVGTVKDLKKGAQVSVTASYSLSAGTWQITRIVLQP